MTVATFIQPDFASQDPIDVKTSIQNCFVVHNRIAGSFAAHEQDPADMTIRIDAGSLMVLGNVLEVGGQNTATLVASSDLTKIYRIARVLVKTSDGSCAVVYGAEYASTPVIPAITTGYIPICQVLLTKDMTEISNLLITDERIMGGGGGKEAIAIDGIYISMSSANPAADLGYGTWAPIGSGRIPIGVSPDFPEGTTGGSFAPVSISHNHSADHAHTISSGEQPGGFGEGVHNQISGVDENVFSTGNGGTTVPIMNPYFACYFWKRTA